MRPGARNFAIARHTSASGFRGKETETATSKEQFGGQRRIHMAPSVLIIGAGVIGANLAWELARRGAAVTVIDAAEAGSGTYRADGRQHSGINGKDGGLRH